MYVHEASKSKAMVIGDRAFYEYPRPNTSVYIAKSTYIRPYGPALVKQDVEVALAMCRRSACDTAASFLPPLHVRHTKSSTTLCQSHDKRAVI